MKLLVVTQYFWPETFMINELVSTLRDQGHQVVVATGKPNYPAGRIFPGYEARGTQRETFDGDIPVVRVPLRPRGTGAVGLFLNYLSFAWSGAIRFPGLLRDFAPDAILMYAPSPILGAIAAIPLKWTKRAHLALWVQDLWPESLAATGYVTNKAALAAVAVVVRGIYACADTLLVQSHAFVEPVAALARRSKIVYYPNSTRALADDRTTPPMPPDLDRVLASHFCVVFGGNLGSVQAVPTMIGAAEQLADLPDVRVVLVGDGSMSAWVREQVRARGLTNVVTIDRQPASLMPSVYRRAGALLVALKDDDVLSYTVPSKVQTYLAAGRPIIAAMRGEGARLVAESGAGVACRAEDAAALAGCVRDLYHRTEAERAAMGHAGARYFAEHFDMDAQARRLTAILAERLGSRGRTH